MNVKEKKDKIIELLVLGNFHWYLDRGRFCTNVGKYTFEIYQNSNGDIYVDDTVFIGRSEELLAKATAYIDYERDKKQHEFLDPILEVLCSF